jgi:hypothetical protein
MKIIKSVSSALVWGFCQETTKVLNRNINSFECERFILFQIKNLPFWFIFPFSILSLSINFFALFISYGWFTRLTPDYRSRLVNIFEIIPGPTREFIRFHRILVNFYILSNISDL